MKPNSVLQVAAETEDSTPFQLNSAQAIAVTSNRSRRGLKPGHGGVFVILTVG